MVAFEVATADWVLFSMLRVFCLAVIKLLLRPLEHIIVVIVASRILDG